MALTFGVASVLSAVARIHACRLFCLAKYVS